MDIMMGMGIMKKKTLIKVEEDTPTLNIDLHSHINPGIDDGSKSMEESLLLLKALQDAGYYKVITTPHIMIDSYRNTKKIIMEGLSQLVEAKNNVGLKIEVEAAAEYYLDEGFLSQLRSEEILLLSNEYILFETSYLAKPLQFDEMLDEIIARGYKPLLAHPERYRYINDMEKVYREWKDKGIYFQININSFGGHYGKDAKKKALFLRDNAMIDFLGSDVHHLKQVKTLVKIKKQKIYKKIFEKNFILNNLLES